MRRVPFRTLPLVAVLVALAPPLAGQGGAKRSTVASLVDALACTPFTWREWKGVTAKGAMFVPMTLDGRTVGMQLDTGANVTILYGDSAYIQRTYGLQLMRDRPTSTPYVMAKGVSFGRGAAREQRIYVMTDMQPDDSSAGTVGLDQFRGRATVIDYPGRRVCVAPRDALPPALVGRTHLTAAAIRDNKFFVRPSLDGTVLEGIFFDTGASAEMLAVDSADWATYTRRTPQDRRNGKRTGMSWGKPYTSLIAPATGTMTFGDTRFAHPLVTYRREEPDHFAKFPFPARGLMGNAPFWNEVIVLIADDRPAFGVVR